jgi:hypothetical protein
VRLYSNVGTVSQTVRSGNGPYIDRYHARHVLLTVFSITKSDHLITQLSIYVNTGLWIHTLSFNICVLYDQID